MKNDIERIRVNRNAEKYGLIGWRKAKRKMGNALGTLGVIFLILLFLAFTIAPLYVIGHFIVKYW